MYHVQGYNVLKMEILKSLVKVWEQRLRMAGMSGKKALQGNRLLNGYKGVPEMTESEAKKYMLIEKECINRDCNRDCANCDIVQNVEDLNNAYDVAIKALEQSPEMDQFAKWVAEEIFDDMWEYNKDAFAEIACRKLAKLGIVRAKGDEWELVEREEEE